MIAVSRVPPKGGPGSPASGSSPCTTSIPQLPFRLLPLDQDRAPCASVLLLITVRPTFVAPSLATRWSPGWRTAADLMKVYQRLNAGVVIERKDTEITAVFSAAALVFAVASALLSVLWYHRIL